MILFMLNVRRKSLAEKANVKLPRHTHPKASKLIKFAKAIDLHNSKLPEGQKESLRTMCGYILEGNCKL